MVHMDAAGRRLRMRDGKVKEGKNGSKVMMKNNARGDTPLSARRLR